MLLQAQDANLYNLNIEKHIFIAMVLMSLLPLEF